MTTTNRTPWTPGPWIVSRDGRINDKHGIRIADVSLTYGTLNQHHHNETLIALAPEMADSLTDAEAAIGENLVWITDCADLLVRQKDPEALRRLKQLNDAWLSLVKITSRLPKGE